MGTKLSRRDFLKLSALGLTSLAFRPSLNEPSSMEMDIARVAISRATGSLSTPSVSVYSQPSDKSKILYQRYRDELVHIYYEVTSEDGPSYNPLWYRVWRGYIHSAHLEIVKSRLNPILPSVNPKGQLTEVTVPYTKSLRFTKAYGWEPLYRLYYGSLHWIMDVSEGPDGEPWYRIEDEMDKSYTYFVSAPHLRPILANEYAPLSPDVPPEAKKIEVSIARQMLTAYEDDKIVMQTKISSGMSMPNPPPGMIPTDTPTGTFHIQSKMPSKHMGDGQLSSDLYAYELPGVPWVSFFEPETGVAFHGTYWHNNFGTQMSHGCINMRTEEAKWIFRWATPVNAPEDWEKRGYGTEVVVA